jgi:hypothetical protein
MRGERLGEQRSAEANRSETNRQQARTVASTAWKRWLTLPQRGQRAVVAQKAAPLQKEAAAAEPTRARATVCTN